MWGASPRRSMDKLSFSSDHVNYLILRYLQESGFAHTSYTFYHECQANRADLEPSTVPPGALIHVVQKGLQFIELEANLTQDGTEMDGEYSFLNSKDLITKDVDELRRTVRKRRESVRREKDERDKTTFNAGGGGAAAAAAAAAAGGGGGGGGDPMEEEAPVPVVKMENTEIPPHQVSTLRGHSSEVFICAWSPTENLLASGSGDATARIWDLGEGGGTDKPTILKHVNQQTPGNKSKDVTTMDWSLDGSFLATGSYDGLARIWTKEGELAKTFSSHRGPIFSLKWNKKGGFLLSGSVDHTAIVWDTKTGEAKQKFCFHKAATLDVDWRNNSTFATCSTDKMIYVCKLGEEDPLRTYKGHDNEVNAIMWDPSGRLLASCSDDTTARIWNMNQDECVRVLKDHTKEIYTVKWSPTGAGTPNANLPLLLASASFDTTIKIWNVEHGKCLHNMCKHSDSVYSVAFSPDGRFLASGSFDKRVHIWSVFDGSLVKTYNGKGGIFEVCWNKDGDKVAASCSNKVVSVLDIRM